MSSNTKKTIAVFGATSLVGDPLIQQLVQQGHQVIALSRDISDKQQEETSLTWLQANGLSSCSSDIDYCISAAPIWVLPDYFPTLLDLNIKSVVAVSSTSIFSKQESNNPQDQMIAKQLQDAEKSLIDWATRNDINWNILRPTLIYGYQKDKNISEISRFIQRFGFFPLFGEADGLRQPIHADDVAKACWQSLLSEKGENGSYQITGAETLTYREMVTRVFRSKNKRPRFIQIPMGLFRLGLSVLKVLPRFRQWSPQMVERMNKDLVFDHSLAEKNFGFSPKNFEP